MYTGALRLVQTTRFRVSENVTKIQGPIDVYNLIHPHVEREPTEVFWVLALDTQHAVYRNRPIIVTQGTLDCSVVHPREVFRAAIVAGAAALVLCHNHPSGDPTPSREDRDVTDQLVSAGKIIGIPILDHVVVGHDRYVSFVETGLINS